MANVYDSVSDTQNNDNVIYDPKLVSKRLKAAAKLPLYPINHPLKAAFYSIMASPWRLAAAASGNGYQYPGAAFIVGGRIGTSIYKGAFNIAAGITKNLNSFAYSNMPERLKTMAFVGKAANWLFGGKEGENFLTRSIRASSKFFVGGAKPWFTSEPIERSFENVGKYGLKGVFEVGKGTKAGEYVVNFKNIARVSAKGNEISSSFAFNVANEDMEKTISNELIKTVRSKLRFPSAQEEAVKDLTKNVSNVISKYKFMSGVSKVVQKLAVPAAYFAIGYDAFMVTKALTNAVFTGFEYTRTSLAKLNNNMQHLEFGGALYSAYMTQAALTERQRAMQAMQVVGVNARNYIGNEAGIMHGMVRS